MKDELRSESQAEIWRGGKIRESPFFCPAYFFAIPFRWASNRGAQSKPVKRGQIHPAQAVVFRLIQPNFGLIRGNSCQKKYKSPHLNAS
jgi:hypothetical protein